MSNNYKPTKWLGGKTIGTAQVMNNIEQGISNAHDRLDSVDSDIVDINGVLNAIQQPKQSLKGDGYITLPGGLIIQWGTSSLTFNNQSKNNKMITYPIPFPNKVFTVQITSTSNNELFSMAGYTTRLNEFQAWLNNNNYGVSITGTHHFAWLAIGY